MANIFDIAKKAGVSITTVSRALNNYSDVNENTRQRVLEIAGQLNYFPSAAARHLQGKKTNTIAYAPILANKDEIHPFLKEFLAVLTLACLNHDLSLLVALDKKGGNSPEIYRELAGTGRVDGVILADVIPEDPRVEFLTGLGLPFVAFGRASAFASLDYPFVDVDGAGGIKEMTGHLVRQGHRRIAYFSDPFKVTWSFFRYQGYQEGLAEAGLAEDPHLVQLDINSPGRLETALKKVMLLPAKERPTAVIASHDLLALDILACLNELKIPVGKEAGQVALCGFDDLPFAAFLQPPLTTLSQPIPLICTVLLEVLVSLLKKEEVKLPPEQTGKDRLTRLGPRQFLVTPRLVQRDSA